MASRANPNTPSSQRRKTAAQLKSKRKHTQRVITRSRKTKSAGVGKVTGSSQTIRKENARRRRTGVGGEGRRRDVIEKLEMDEERRQGIERMEVNKEGRKAKAEKRREEAGKSDTHGDVVAEGSMDLDI